MTNAGLSLPCHKISCTGSMKSLLYGVCSKALPLSPADLGLLSAHLARMGFALWFLASHPPAQFPCHHIFSSPCCMTYSITSSSLAPIIFSSRFLGPQRPVPANLPFTFHTSFSPQALAVQHPLPWFAGRFKPSCSLQLRAAVQQGEAMCHCPLCAVFGINRKVLPPICKTW